MRLEITAVAGPGTVPFQPVELSISIPVSSPPPEDASSPGSNIHPALALRWPESTFTVAGRYVQELIPGRRPLTDGAVVVVHAAGTGSGAGSTSAPRDPAQRPTVPAHALFTVHTGPGAGAVFPLRRGSYTLGRGQCEIVIADPALSRHHGTLEVGEQSMTLTAAPGSAGFSVLRSWRDAPAASAIPVKGPVRVQAGDLIRCGSSSFSIVLDTPAGGGGPATGAGLNSPAACWNIAALTPLVVPHTAESGRGRWAMLAAALLPLVTGALIALLTGSWVFLAFASMGALAALIPLVGGPKRRRRFAVAIADATVRDTDRRRAAFPGADELVMLAHAAGVLGTDTDAFPGRGPPAGQLALRVGTAEQAALLALSSVRPGFTPPLVRELPVTVPLEAGVLEIDGTAASTALLLNFFLMQLDAAAVPVVLMGPLAHLPLSARFLAQTVLATSPAAAVMAVAAAVRDAATPCVLVSIHESPEPVTVAFPELRVVHFRSPAAYSVAASAGQQANRRLSLNANNAGGTFNGLAFVPDGVPAAVFSKYARDRGSGLHRPSPPTDLRPLYLPRQAASTPEAVSRVWRGAANTPLGPVTIGESVHGEELFDFTHDGPHLLVGGTTGSGKSEFLRTLAGSLAAAHSPADLQFVLLDFKGGAGLGPLVQFPHTTSLITDLDGHGMERTLASLRAEIHRRERTLGLAGAADSSVYRSMLSTPGGQTAARDTRSGMAHLVIVVDEFRVLVDQFPLAMTELMRIAAVGRSLGIHLVMATQRPQGALNADIRANVTSSVCLRVQTTFDSQDVIGTALAAAIGVDTPGRAYIRRAGTPPIEFQCATLRLPDSGHNERVAAELATVVLAARANNAAPPSSLVEASDVAPVAALLSDAWRLLTGQDATILAAPHVVASGLPPDVETRAAEFPLPRTDPESLLMGLVDVPERQSLEPLRWSPEQHSHLACIGRPGTASAVVGLIAERLLAANTVRHKDRQRFLYLLDGDGSLAPWAGNPQVGAHATPLRLRTAARLLTRLTEMGSATKEPLALCVSDWGRWVGALRSSPWPGAEDAMAELVRQGQVTVVLGGERELLTAPFMAAIPNRVFLPFGASLESRLFWPKTPEFPDNPGRATIFGPFNAAAAQGPADCAHVAQLARPEPAPQGARGDKRTRHGPVVQNHFGALPPLVVRDLPENLTVAQARASVTTAAGVPPVQTPTIVVGLGGDRSIPISVSLTAGMALPVMGGPGSGRSTFINAVKALNGHLHGGRPGRTGHQDAIMWVDDPATLSVEQQAALTQGLAEGKSMVLTLSNQLNTPARLPLEWGLRTAELGIVLRPRRSQDGELFGVRLDTEGSEPPGRAVLIDRGHCEWFQFPY
ncbi:FtsK/SpoIIIE domain-containing protein [Arthrobacter sp. AQ5-05]|uniref:FtsK/SpoIIIE domain-containing protein n=1 Tax=Arthrobacter sp. AQ5-05 TaxID=2184581 RepID=UPI0012B65B22|nr:FtsK/SpoIIIE domain-containing protein [Arthrobacter sp. AQ5-05]